MRRYLLVDDNHAFTENLAEILAEHGAEVVSATNSRDALERLKAGRFDAMLTDMRMPGMNGGALVQEARRIDPGLPVVVATAFAAEAQLALAREGGVLAVLTKPVDVLRLLQLLDDARRVEPVLRA